MCLARSCGARADLQSPRPQRSNKQELVKGGIEFVVEQYREILQMGVGQCVTSESFKVQARALCHCPAPPRPVPPCPSATA